jgi:hypothetical protein
LTIPLHPRPPHPDHGALLHLKNGKKLKKDSYVKAGEVVAVELKYLKHFSDGGSGQRFELTRQSLDKVRELRKDAR